MKQIIICITMLLCHTGLMAQQHLEEVVDSYIKVKDALVKGDQKSAQLVSEELFAKAKGLKDVGKLERATSELSKQSSLENQRKAFAEVSTALWKLVKDGQGLGKDLYYQYCPMKKTYWLSLEPSIRNPYYGSQMLTCGKVAEQNRK